MDTYVLDRRKPRIAPRLRVASLSEYKVRLCIPGGEKSGITWGKLGFPQNPLI